MQDLFGLVTRDERQAQCLRNWKATGGHGCVEACTGFGKTRIGTNLIQKFVKQYPNFKVIIVVPTITLQEQWSKILDNLGLGLNCEVVVINTAIKHDWKCHLLIIDEIHRAMAKELSQVFQKIKYKYILGLTATIERLDGKHELLKNYCPVCDTVTLELALLNGWVSEYKEYQVIIEVDDIEDYNRYQREFTEHFQFFNYDFNLAMSCLGKDGFKFRSALRDKMCPWNYNRTNEQERKDMFRDITYHATAFQRCMSARKQFIFNHPKKIELARKIIEARPNAKIITFAANVKMAEAIGIGKVYTGKDSKKKGRITIDEFNRGEFQVLSTCQKANEGLDVPGLSVAIQIGIDSSPIKAKQKLGRVIRFEPGKKAEMFTIVIDGTQETKWFETSHTKQQNYITINEKGLEDVLAGKEPEPYIKPLKKFAFRF